MTQCASRGPAPLIWESNVKASRLYRDVGVQLIPQHELEFLPQDVAPTFDGALAWAVREGSALVSGFIRSPSGSATAHILDHDEVIHVLNGRFGVELDSGAVIDAGPGETLNLARGTRVRYVAHNALVFFVRTEPRSSAHVRQMPLASSAEA